jgi:hypothetical protein
MNFEFFFRLLLYHFATINALSGHIKYVFPRLFFHTFVEAMTNSSPSYFETTHSILNNRTKIQSEERLDNCASIQELKKEVITGS